MLSLSCREEPNQWLVTFHSVLGLAASGETSGICKQHRVMRNIIDGELCAWPTEHGAGGEEEDEGEAGSAI